MTQEQFIRKYNLKEFTLPFKNSDGKWMEKLEGYTAELKSLGYIMNIYIIINENDSDSYRIHLKNTLHINTIPYNKEIFAMHTTEWSLFEKTTYDIWNNYINL